MGAGIWRLWRAEGHEVIHWRSEDDTYTVSVHRDGLVPMVALMGTVNAVGMICFIQYSSYMYI